MEADARSRSISEDSTARIVTDYMWNCLIWLPHIRSMILPRKNVCAGAMMIYSAVMIQQSESGGINNTPTFPVSFGLVAV